MKLRKLPRVSKNSIDKRFEVTLQMLNTFEWNEFTANEFIFNLEHRLLQENPDLLPIIRPLLKTFLKIVKEKNSDGKK